MENSSRLSRNAYEYSPPRDTTQLIFDVRETDSSFFDSLQFLLPSSSDSNGRRHIQALEQTLGFLDSILYPNSFLEAESETSTATVDMDSLLPCSTTDRRPKSFLHDEMNEFNEIFSELVSSPLRRIDFRNAALSERDEDDGLASDLKKISRNLFTNVVETWPTPSSRSDDSNGDGRVDLGDDDVVGPREILSSGNHNQSHPCCRFGKSYEPVDCSCRSCACEKQNDDGRSGEPVDATKPACILRRNSDVPTTRSDVGVKKTNRSVSVDAALKCGVVCDKSLTHRSRPYDQLNEEYDADSGYQTGDGSLVAMVTSAKNLEKSPAVGSRDELKKRIESYNDANKQRLTMNLVPDCNVYEGNIRVHINLYRPIRMCLPSRPSSIYDILVRSEARLPSNVGDVASFRLPNDTFKVIHITSETTTFEVIKTLLNKFNITDSPKKFALYERRLMDEKENEEKDESGRNYTYRCIRRIADIDRPLDLCLRWSEQGYDLLDQHQFVLQENDTGDILWEEFSLPELDNFLRILAFEEKGYVNQIRIKYSALRKETERKLKTLENQPTTGTSIGQKTS